MAVVLCLGNPGTRYEDTRHNAGFRVLEALVRRWRARPAGPAERFRAWRADAGGREVTLLGPLTYMNASGEALSDWAGGAPSAEGLLVVCDDVYLATGTLRLRGSGGSGGHRGLESVERTLGTQGYARLRIGVGRAGSSAELREHVLAPPGPEEQAAFEAGLERAAEAVECWLMEGLTVAMNRHNVKEPKEVTEE